LRRAQVNCPGLTIPGFGAGKPIFTSSVHAGPAPGWLRCRTPGHCRGVPDNLRSVTAMRKSLPWRAASADAGLRPEIPAAHRLAGKISLPGN